MILHTHALLGEVLAFRLGRETILLRTGWAQFDQQKAEQIFQVITCHIDFILQGLAQRSLDHEKPVVVLLVVIVLAALGGGWWWYQSSQQKISLSTAMSIFAL